MLPPVTRLWHLRNLASSNVTLPIFNERVAQYSATASSDNPARSLEKSNPKAQQDELVRRVTKDSTMSSCDFGVQFLDPPAMTYWGKHYGADFWIKMPAWAGRKERLYFIVWHGYPSSTFAFVPQESHATYFDVTGLSTPESRPAGSISRARWRAESASKEAPAASISLTQR